MTDETFESADVTPEMIEAGYAKFLDLPELLYGCPREEFISAIGEAFRAMWTVHAREVCSP
jgi:hypothetical protein